MSTENQFDMNQKKPVKGVSKPFAVKKNLSNCKSEKKVLLTKEEKQISSVVTAASRINLTGKIEGLNYSKNAPVFARLKNIMDFQAIGLVHLKHKNSSLSFKMAQNLVDSTDPLKIKELTSSNKLNELKGWPSKFSLLKSMTHFEKPFPSFKNKASNATKKSPFPNIKMGDELSEKQPVENNLINFKTNATNVLNSDLNIAKHAVKPLNDDIIEQLRQLFTETLVESLQDVTKPFLTKMELLKDEFKEALNTKSQGLEGNFNPQSNQDEELMEVEEVIKFLKISSSTFYRHHKKWKCMKVGSKSFYYKSEILQQLRYHAK
jgi:hypothetical protein